MLYISRKIKFKESFSGRWMDDEENTGAVDFSEGEELEGYVVELENGLYTIAIPGKYMISDIPEDILDVESVRNKKEKTPH